MSGIHNGIENNKLTLFVLIHICVLVSLRPKLNYIYSLCPVMYIKKICSDVKSFLYYSIIKYFFIYFEFFIPG